MQILKFNNFIINEKVQTRVFDLVIDEKGQIKYKGGLPVKGSLDTFNKKILGYDRNYYIAAIDRSGKLFSYLDKDELGNILLDGEKIRTKQFSIDLNIRTMRHFWNTEEDYTSILPILPTGWVNVKIDMEVIKRIRRYSAGITTRSGVEGLKSRLSIIGRDDVKLRKRSSETIRKEMSAIMSLHYLNELKGHFDPSSAGFLFESYIAGMITGSTVNEDNSAIDLTDKRGNKYQIKLLDAYGSGTGIIILEGKFLDYYILGLKYPDKVRIILLNGNDEKSENYVAKFKTRFNDFNFSFSKFRKIDAKTSDFVYDIFLFNIEDRINKIAEGLKETIQDLYKNLSKFQFNVETILTGVDEGGKLLKEYQFDKIERESFINLTNMKKELDNLIGIIKK